MQTLNLFDDLVVDAPETEGIKYAGSKLKLLPHILQLVNKVSPETVLDGFAGTTRVSPTPDGWMPFARKSNAFHFQRLKKRCC